MTIASLLLAVAVATADVPQQNVSSIGKMYRYIGCYADTQSQRDLPVWFCSNGGGADPNGGCGSDPNAPGYSAWAGGAAMTPTVCSVLCSGQKYFGIEVGYQCYCGNVLGKEATEVNEKECNSRCTGEQNLDSNCGGLVGSPGSYKGRISVYQASRPGSAPS